MKIIIDAYNLVNYLKSLDSFECSGNCIDELVEYLSKILSDKNDIIIAIDGFSYPEKLAPKNFHLIFSGNNDSADNLIKERIRRDNSKQGLAIVSSDLEVYNYARINAKIAYTSEEFINLFYSGVSEKSEKPDSMTQSDLDFFSSAFGLENPLIDGNNKENTKMSNSDKRVDTNQLFSGSNKEETEKPSEISKEEVEEMKKLFGLK